MKMRITVRMMIMSRTRITRIETTITMDSLAVVGMMGAEGVDVAEGVAMAVCVAEGVAMAVGVTVGVAMCVAMVIAVGVSDMMAVLG